MSQYELIDPILTKWAKKNSVTWFAEYQDTPVRTFFLNFSRRDRIQISVDAPKAGCTTIRVGQYRKGLRRLNRVENVTSSVLESDLLVALDRAMYTAIEWAAE